MGGRDRGQGLKEEIPEESRGALQSAVRGVCPKRAPLRSAYEAPVSEPLSAFLYCSWGSRT